MHGWDVVLELITILASAIVAGAIFERIRLGATIGYILAGIIIGPKALGLVQNQDTVYGLAEFGIALVLFSSAPWIAITGFGLVGAGVSCIFPLILSAAARTPGVARGTGIAAMATVGYTGFLIGPPLIGSIAELFSLRGALGVLGIFGVLIILLGSSVRGEKLAQEETV